MHDMQLQRAGLQPTVNKAVDELVERLVAGALAAQEGSPPILLPSKYGIENPGTVTEHAREALRVVSLSDDLPTATWLLSKLPGDPFRKIEAEPALLKSVRVTTFCLGRFQAWVDDETLESYQILTRSGEAVYMVHGFHGGKPHHPLQFAEKHLTAQYNWWIAMAEQPVSWSQTGRGNKLDTDREDLYIRYRDGKKPGSAGSRMTENQFLTIYKAISDGVPIIDEKKLFYETEELQRIRKSAWQQFRAWLKLNPS